MTMEEMDPSALLAKLPEQIRPKGAPLPSEDEVNEFHDKVDEVTRMIESLREGNLPPEYVDRKIEERQEKEEKKKQQEEEAKRQAEEEKQLTPEREAELRERAEELKQSYERKQKYVCNVSFAHCMCSPACLLPAVLTGSLYIVAGHGQSTTSTCLRSRPSPPVQITSNGICGVHLMKRMSSSANSQCQTHPSLRPWKKTSMTDTKGAHQFNLVLAVLRHCSHHAGERLGSSRCCWGWPHRSASRQAAPLPDCLCLCRQIKSRQIAERCRVQGNELFKKGQWTAAYDWCEGTAASPSPLPAHAVPLRLSAHHRSMWSLDRRPIRAQQQHSGRRLTSRR